MITSLLKSRAAWHARCLNAAAVVLVLPIASAQPATQNHTDHIARVIDQAVNQAQLPAGFKGMVIGYLDSFGPVYKTYGAAAGDGTVPLNEKTLFGVGSVTKTFTATLLAVANVKGLPLTTPVVSLLPSTAQIQPSQNRYNISLLNLADHHGGLPKNDAHLYNSVNDLYRYYAADPITCDPSTPELIRDCGCCDPVYAALLGLPPTCGPGVANPVYSCRTHPPTQGPDGWLYSNLGFEVLGATVARWLGYPDWDRANAAEITVPLNLTDTMALESFGPSQVARAANHCNPATRSTNPNCRLLDRLPGDSAAGGLFSTASDMLQFLSYNAYGVTTPAAARLSAALPLIHQNYETSTLGGQELAWQTWSLVTGEFLRAKDGANGPFNSWMGYVTGPLTRMVVLLDNSGVSAADLKAIGSQILVDTGPSISGVTTANGGTDVAANDWIVIYGTNLAPVDAPAAGVIWSNAPEFASGQMPVKLANVSVTVNNKPAFVYFYCSAVTSACATDQINVLTPLDTATGAVKVVVNNSSVRSPAFSANMKSVSPAFLQFSAKGYVVATHTDNSLLGPASLYPGASTPAKPGEIAVVYGVGFGLPSGSLVNGSSSQSGPLPSMPVCRIGSAPAAVSVAALASPGLYVFAITIPNSAPNGDNPISCTYAGATTPSGNIITVQR